MVHTVYARQTRQARPAGGGHRQVAGWLQVACRTSGASVGDRQEERQEVKKGHTTTTLDGRGQVDANALRTLSSYMRLVLVVTVRVCIHRRKRKDRGRPLCLSLMDLSHDDFIVLEPRRHGRPNHREGRRRMNLFRPCSSCRVQRSRYSAGRPAGMNHTCPRMFLSSA